VRSVFDAVITLRAAKPSDTRFIRQLAGQAFAEYDPTAALTTGNMLLEPGARALLAERAGRPLGFVIVRPQAGQALALNAIAVAERERGRGVGQRLLRAVEQFARARGCRTLALTTAQANVAALELFLRSGFEIVDRSSRHYFGGQPACRLEKRLA
jgi:ribosomal protein S18 acetylase RimI-like enzyme